MSVKLKPANFFFWVLSIGLGLAGLAFSKAEAPTNVPVLARFSDTFLSTENGGDDTVKYRGYRLEITEVAILKQTDDWVKISFSIVNSGRVDVDFTKKGTLHWVKFVYDYTLFSNKLGGLRENIQQTLYDENFKLPVGQTIKKKELKVPVILLKKAMPTETVAGGFETKVGTSIEQLEAEDPSNVAGKGGDDTPDATGTIQPGIRQDCPDIFFQRLRILQQDDKWATVEYTISNKGHGSFMLFEKGGKAEEKLVIKAYISGVPSLSRGALSVGGQIVKPLSGQTLELQPGDIYINQMKVDIRKKTRYMKSLILSLDSDQFKFECDKTNNTDAVILN
jgi:hypothetical protein